MESQGGLQGCLSNPESVGGYIDPGQARRLLQDSLADKGRCDRPLACPSGCWRRSGAKGWHTTHVPSRASRKPGARLLLRVVMLTTRVLQTSKSLLRVVAATSCDLCDLRTWGWRASGLVCGRSSEKRGLVDSRGKKRGGLLAVLLNPWYLFVDPC